MTSVDEATSSSATKFKLEQKMPNGNVKKGSHTAEQSMDPSDVVIKRRFGEGSKRLFQRDDITLNRDVSTVTSSLTSSNSKSTQRPPTRHDGSTDSSSPERYRQRGSNKSHHTGTKRSKTHSIASSPTVLPMKRRNPEKIPYFLDEKREKDRLRRIYGGRSYSRSRSRTRSPPASKSHSSRRRSSSRSRYESSSRSNRRSSRERNRDHHHRSLSGDRRHHSSRSTHRRRRSRSLSPSHRRSRERDRARSRDRYESAEAVTKDTQIITIPVPVPGYPYSYPTWPQHAWGAPAPHAGPPPRFAPYPMAPMMPPIRPPYGMPPFNACMFRPPMRYPTQNYAARPARGNFRPKNS